VDGVLVIDKPVGPTSHDVVARIRRAIGERRVGHTGTLDPNASGVLPLVIGRATRLAKFLSASEKTYEAVIRFGVATDSYDAAGVPSSTGSAVPTPGREAIEAALGRFRGMFDQQPPAFSAKKIAGSRSYEAARASRLRHSRAASQAALSVDSAGSAGSGASSIDNGRPPFPRPAPVRVTVHALTLGDVTGSRIALTVRCSSGFYVRSLAHDLGEALGGAAHLEQLRRTECGGFALDTALPLDIAESTPAAAVAALVPMALALPALPAVTLTDEGAERAAHGRDIRPSDVDVGHEAPTSGETCGGPSRSSGSGWSLPPGSVRLLGRDGELIAIGEATSASALLHPSIVLV